MKLTIEITLDNAAFEDPAEVARILATAATRLPDPLDWTDSPIRLMDNNGNTVGSARIE